MLHSGFPFRMVDSCLESWASKYRAFLLGPASEHLGHYQEVGWVPVESFALAADEEQQTQQMHQQQGEVVGVEVVEDPLVLKGWAGLPFFLSIGDCSAMKKAGRPRGWKGWGSYSICGGEGPGGRRTSRKGLRNELKGRWILGCMMQGVNGLSGNHW